MILRQKKTVEEFNISVPWGHIAIKTWGTKNDPHVLMVHGTADNLGTFDNLLPFLSNGFYYICMDLPGHGRSSHFPPHLPIHSTDYAIAIKLVVEHFKKETFFYIGHSLGGQVGYLFAQLYPQYIKKFISLDAMPQFFPIEPAMLMKYLRNRMEKNIALQEKLAKGTQPTYTYEEILDKFCKDRYRGETLTKEAAEPLLKRCLESTGDGKYYLTTDQRPKAQIDPENDTRYKILSMENDPVTCPILIVYAKHNTYPRKKYVDIVKACTKFKNVTTVYIDGMHDVHNKNPESVAKYVNTFLLKVQAKL